MRNNCGRDERMAFFKMSMMGRGPFGPWGGRGRGGPGREGPEGRDGQEGHHHRGRGSRPDGSALEELSFKKIFGHGDLRFVILSFLENQPSHGYELIKAIEDRTSGNYVPSPGVIYPTLTFLQEGGYATVTSEQGKNLYTITDSGRAILSENREMVDAIFERVDFMKEKMSKLREWMGRDGMEERGRHMRGPIHQAFHKLREALGQHMSRTDKDQEAVAGIIEKAAEEIKKLRSDPEKKD